MLQLPMPETRVMLDDAGQVIGVEPEDASYPHTVIEMFMVEANVAVASLLDPLCIPFMRRVHPDPDPVALRQLSQTLRLLGVTLSRQPSRSDFQALFDQVRDTQIALPVNLLVLRSLERAAYSPLSVGHYALAAAKYCHFTSPIRRYADLLVHRALQAWLTGHMDRGRREHSVSDLVEIGRHISDTERAAEDAEKEVKAIFVLHLLRQRIGQELDGVVMSLTGYGAFVLLPEYGVEGLIRPEALGPDLWQYDEQYQCLVGRHTRAVLRLAQNIRVRIVEVHPAAGQFDLAPAVDLPVRMPRRTQTQAHPRHTPKRRQGHRGRQ
jgi:ribonuclease R